MLEQHLVALLSLGLLQPRVGRAESLAALAEVGPADAAQLLVRHKVGRIAMAVATELADGAGEPDAAGLRRLATEIGERRGHLDRSLATADEVLGALRDRLPDAHVLLMKGLVARDRYPADRPRDVGDADLWTPDVDTGWRVAAALRDLGYEYETAELPWLKREMDGTLFGQIKLLDPADRTIAVDIHMGPYSIRYCGLIRFVASADQPPWGPLTREDNLCGVIGNVAGDCFIDAKTINDVVTALTPDRGYRMDLAYVAERLAEAGLSGFVNALVDVTASVCALREEQVAALSALRVDTEPEQIGLTATPDPDRRVRLVTDHAREMGHRLTNDPAAAAHIADEARSAYQTAKRYRMVRLDPQRSFLPELNPWTCLRLAPQPMLHELFQRTLSLPFPVQRTTALAHGLDRIESRMGDLVRFGDDVFVPTLDYVFPALLVYGRPE